MIDDTWNSYLSRIINHQDEGLFEEAAKAACAWAPRAAYIAVWLSCAESLKRKFKEAMQFDGEARKIIGELNGKESRQLAIDTYILTKAKEYGFVSDTEFAQLQSVYMQRCIYGHPYEQAPLREQVLAAAATVVEYVLSRPLSLRHGYLDRQVQNLCHQPLFLDDHYDAVASFARIVHARSSQDLYIWFLRKLWKEAGILAGDPSIQMYLRRVVYFTSAFLKECDASFFTGWDVSQDLTQYPFVASSLAIPELFPRIPEHSRDIVIGNMLSAAKTDVKFLRTVEILQNSCVLTSRHSVRFVEAINSLPYYVAAISGIHPAWCVDRVITALKSYNWDTQNVASNVIRQWGPACVGVLTPEQQFLLGSNILQAADGSARTPISLLSHIAKSSESWPESFIEGIVSECVLDDLNKFRFKSKYASDAFNCLRQEMASNVLSRLVSRFQNSIPKYQAAFANDKSNCLATLDSIIANRTDLAASLFALRTAVSHVEIPQT